MRTTTRWLVPGLASIAIMLAASATLELVAHPTVVGCPGSAVTGLIDCGAVVTSPGGKILGLPLGGWALLWLFLYWLSHVLGRGRLIPIIAIAGFLGVAYAVGTELRVGHLCAWCTIVQLSIVTLGAWSLATYGRQVPHRE
jgi:uncharacterized membrane protein